MAEVELIRAEFDDPVLADLLAAWRGQVDKILAMRQGSFDRATRTATGAARWRIIHEEVMREYQPIVDYLVGKMIKIEGLRPPPMIRLR